MRLSDPGAGTTRPKMVLGSGATEGLADGPGADADGLAELGAQAAKARTRLAARVLDARR